MRIEFTVEGEPQGKGRPKFSRHGSYVSVRTPEKTREYEENIKASFLECNTQKFPEGSQLELNITAYFKIPKSATKIKSIEMRLGRIRPTKKPDADNILKVVADALNGVAYKDDSCLVKMSAEKIYSDFPRIEVVLHEWQMEEKVHNV